MREILFRGKRIDSELWVEGSLVNNIFFRAESNRPIPYIIDPHEYESYDCMEDIGELAVEVIEDTVGQFTGLHDKNGVDIFEGDVVKWEDKRIDSYFAGQICFNESQWQVEGLSVANLNLFRGIGEVIGNIHEGATPCTSATVE